MRPGAELLASVFKGWIALSTVDSAIQRLNYRGLKKNVRFTEDFIM